MMTEKTEIPAYENINEAPVIYFDIAPAHGIMGGIIQIELASRILNAMPDESVEVKFITTGRIRCSGGIELTQCSRCLAKNAGATAARAGGNRKAELTVYRARPASSLPSYHTQCRSSRSALALTVYLLLPLNPGDRQICQPQRPPFAVVKKRRDALPRFVVGPTVRVTFVDKITGGYVDCAMILGKGLFKTVHGFNP